MSHNQPDAGFANGRRSFDEMRWHSQPRCHSPNLAVRSTWESTASAALGLPGLVAETARGESGRWDSKTAKWRMLARVLTRGQDALFGRNDTISFESARREGRK